MTTSVSLTRLARSYRQRSIVRTALFFGLIATGTACADVASPPDGFVPPGSVPGPTLSRLRVSVDLRNGTMTFQPAGDRSTPSAEGFRPQIYGQQGQLVLLYNDPPVITDPSSPGRKTISANVGVRNLLTHRIGDEQNALLPPDTMGIYVFFTQLPTVTQPQPCTGCTVAIANAMGTLAFDAPNEPYFHWPELLGAAGLLQDTTLVRRNWVFDASQAVVQFSFEVLVSAAWPAPDETSWRIEYAGDSLPDTRSEPLWKRGGTGTASAAGGVLTLTVPAGLALSYTRQDSVGAADNAFMSATMRMGANVAGTVPIAGFVLNDDFRAIGVGISGSQVGFTNADLSAFIPGTTRSFPSSSTFFDYQLRKFGSDSVQLWVGGARQEVLPYASFDLDNRLLVPSFQNFVVRGQGGTATTQFDNVIYRLGQSTP